MRRWRGLSIGPVLGLLGLATVAQAIDAGLTPAGAWSETVLLHFTNGNDGGYPYAGLTLGPAGALYGTTPNGGDHGAGTVFELAPAAAGSARSARVLYSFSGAADGAHPLAGVTLGAAGKLYGTTLSGGAAGQGTVFELTPPAASGGAWSEHVLCSFGGAADGGSPVAGVVFDGSGVLYGTTLSGGARGRGTVFKLIPAAAGGWSASVLHSFAGGDDGELPFAGVIPGPSGRLYGTTSYGGAHGFGTVFGLTPGAAGAAWPATVLYSFAGKDDGGLPGAGVVLDAAGALYGTTRWGGAQSSGTAFKLTPPAAPGQAWTETVLHAFEGGFTSGGDGGAPIGGVILDGAGALYGTTDRGGAHGNGTVFKLTPPAGAGGAWTVAVLHSFSGSDGSGPAASVTLSGGRLFGTTFRGGARGGGTVFELVP
jgi:uncharacterized repeat protein (TIGR03803 family)